MIFCLLTALAWGVWTICLKQATRALPPAAVQGLTTAVNLFLIPGYWYLLHIQKAKLDVGSAGFRVGVTWAVVSVAFAAAGGLSNLMALNRMDAGVVAVMTAMTPAVTMFASIAIGQESFTLTKGLGAFFVIMGVVTLSL
jgi:drug/metabolite transporter (DMT)-like permease